MKKNKRKLIAIVGPTASGKTGLAVFLASAIGEPASGWKGVEIVSADSRQVYRGLDIGTGKDLKEYGDIKYHLIDICEPEEKFTMFDWLERARVVIEDIFERGKLPIIVGGTGLYVQALAEGFSLQKIQNPKSKCQINSKIQIPKYKREELDKMALAELQNITRMLLSN
jgi:tRNA dimethylallyltransferase